MRFRPLPWRLGCRVARAQLWAQRADFCDLRRRPLAHSTTHTFTARVQNASPAGGGWSDPVTCTGTTAVLGVTLTGVSSTTRTINASLAATNGNSTSLTLENVRTDWNVTDATWDPLTHGTGYTVTARNYDGYNDVFAQHYVTTATITASAPTAAISGGGEAPRTLTVSATGGGATPWGVAVSHQVRLGSTDANIRGGSSAGYSVSTAGSYYGYARTVATDGHNTVYSGWDSAGPVTVTDPWPSNWGSAPGCPAIYVTIYSNSPRTWEGRRASSTTCQVRWTVTEAGATYELPEGTIVTTGTYVLGSGATAFTKTGGAENWPLSPIIWP